MINKNIDIGSLSLYDTTGFAGWEEEDSDKRVVKNY